MQSFQAVAVLNTSPDTIEMLRRVLQHAGFAVVTGYIHDIRDGRLDVAAFMREHDPSVVVYDIALPYDQQWTFFQHLKSRPALAGRSFVLTTTNAAEVEKVAGHDEHVYEIIGKPYDLGDIVRAVKEACRSRPTR